MITLNKLVEVIDSNLIPDVPGEAAQEYKVLPVSLDNNTLHLATCSNLNVSTINDLKFILGKEVVLQVWSEDEIEGALEHFYKSNGDKIVEELNEFQVVEKNGELSISEKGSRETDSASIIKIVNQVITCAIRQRASDIHIEPYERQLRVRFRIDGVLQNRDELDISKKQALISRLKIMADLDIAEKRRPQDGRIRVEDDQRAIDIRVSTLPTDFGEKIVLRILDKDVLQLELGRLGFDDSETQLYEDAVSSPYGMILVTGPTGSGKTTTLYATLNHLNQETTNILTIEDPIEYNLPGVNQAHMRADIGFSFAKALKTFLRQDPDIIMVGEIRDFETAEIAVRAALTGHLVVSTLHTNDAPGAITRLVDMGVEPFLVGSCVRLVVAQRLVRTICPHCKEENEPPPSLIKSIGSEEAKNINKFYVGRGCKLCYHTGYLGRTALFEIMQINELVPMITQAKPASELKNRAVKSGMKTLRQSGLAKVKQGITTLDEVLRETRG